MSSAILGRSTRYCSGALLAFLAWAVVVPGSALAGCPSHDVPTITFPDGQGVGLETLDRAAERAVADVTGIPGRPRPCTGEMCSGRPSMPLSPAPSEAPRIGSWAILAVTILIVAPERVESQLDDGSVRPVQSSCSIFHPPRPTPSPLQS
jgi:hypothetical protein